MWRLSLEDSVSVYSDQVWSAKRTVPDHAPPSNGTRKPMESLLRAVNRCFSRQLVRCPTLKVENSAASELLVRK